MRWWRAGNGRTGAEPRRPGPTADALTRRGALETKRLPRGGREVEPCRLAQRMPWARLEAALAANFGREARPLRERAMEDPWGASVRVTGGAVSAAGRPRLPLRLMVSLPYLKHAFNPSDGELVPRWSENVVWQYSSGLAYYEPRLPCCVRLATTCAG